MSLLVLCFPILIVSDSERQKTKKAKLLYYIMLLVFHQNKDVPEACYDMPEISLGQEITGKSQQRITNQKTVA